MKSVMKKDFMTKLKIPISWIQKAINFLKEVQIQVKKISWPTTQETFRYTLVVILASLLLAVFLGGADFVFNSFLTKIVL